MTDTRMNQLKMLCSFFNLKAGTHCWANADKTIEVADRAFDKANGEVSVIKEFLRIRINAGEKDFRKALVDFCNMQEIPDEEVEEVVELKAPATQAAAPQIDNLTASMNFMGQVVMELLAKTKLEEIRDTVGASLREDVQKFIAENYGPITRKVVFDTPERKVELEGVVHQKFDSVLKYVKRNIPVFLTGPAGSGKNVLCEQVAKVLGLEFYFSNAHTRI